MNSFDSPKYRIPNQLGNHMTQALLQFIHGQKRKFVDKVSWPHNVGCNAIKVFPTPLPIKIAPLTPTEVASAFRQQIDRHSLKVKSQ